MTVYVVTAGDDWTFVDVFATLEGAQRFVADAEERSAADRRGREAYYEIEEHEMGD